MGLDIKSVGNIPIFSGYVNLANFFSDPHKISHYAFEKCGNLSILGKLKSNVYLSFGAKYNKEFTNPDYFIQMPSPIKRIPNSPITTLASNLLNMNGEKHQEQRKLMIPYLNRAHIKNYFQDMLEITESILDTWKPNSQVNMAEEIKLLALMIASKSLFNIDLKEKALHISNTFLASLELAGNPLVIMLQKDISGLPYHDFVERSKDVIELIKEIIKDKIHDKQDSKDLLSMMINLYHDGKITEEELIGQTYMIFQAAHETTSNTLSWTLFLLSQSPEVCTKILKEIEPFENKYPTFEEVEKLSYLEKVVKESMRVITTSSFGAKKCYKTYETDDFVIQKDSVAIISPYMTHRIEPIYINPKEFNPDRWDNISPNQYEYCPFGSGPHSCLGFKFAMIEMSLLILLILRRYKLKLVPNSRIDRLFKVTLAPKFGLPMYIYNQDGMFEKSEFYGNIKEMVNL